MPSVIRMYHRIKILYYERNAVLMGKKIRTAAFCVILTHSVPPQSWYAPTSLYGINVPTSRKRTAVPLNTKLGSPHCWCGRFGEVKNLTLTGICTTVRPACTIVATIINVIIIIELYAGYLPLYT
jgi:hypothetical protein